MIPSPFIIVCWLRGLSWSIKTGHRIQGHLFAERERAPGQSPRLRRLKCITCGKEDTLWE